MSLRDGAGAVIPRDDRKYGRNSMNYSRSVLRPTDFVDERECPCDAARARQQPAHVAASGRRALVHDNDGARWKFRSPGPVGRPCATKVFRTRMLNVMARELARELTACAHALGHVNWRT